MRVRRSICVNGGSLPARQAFVDATGCRAASVEYWIPHDGLHRLEPAPTAALMAAAEGSGAFVQLIDDHLEALHGASVPGAAVQALVDSVALPANCIGAHVRMEACAGLDHNPWDSAGNWNAESHAAIHHWRAKSHYSAFIRRIDALLDEGWHHHLFLASDLPENYRVFQQVYGDRLRFLPRTLYDRSAEQIRYALADAILLSRCTWLLGSTWSSFSELAMRLATGFEKVEMSGTDF